MSIYSGPSIQFETSASGYASGLTGTLGVRITDGSGGTVVARTTAGISEYPAASGIYITTLTAPATVGQYQIVWDNGGASPDYALEDLVVTTSGYSPDPVVPGPAIDQVLTSAELASLRGSLVSWYPETASIYREATQVADEYGGYGSTSARTLLSSDIPCDLDSSPKNDQERVLAGSLVTNTQVFFVTMPANRDVIVDDKLVITTRSNFTLRVIAVIAPESWELERRLLTTKYMGS